MMIDEDGIRVVGTKHLETWRERGANWAAYPHLRRPKRQSDGVREFEKLGGAYSLQPTTCTVGESKVQAELQASSPPLN